MAFPPIVNDATIALIINCKLNSTFNALVIFNAIKALIDPLSTPAISPITSAQIFATLAEFFIKFNEVLAPEDFFAAIALKSDSLPTVTATPIMSKNIPINITNNNIKTAGIIDSPVIAVVDMNENIIDNTNAVINIVINHLISDESFLSFLYS